MRLHSVLLLLALAGCAKPTDDPKPQAQAPAKPVNPALLEPLLLKDKPAEARTVEEVRAKSQDGDEVVLQGQIPPGAVKSFLNDRAGFVLMMPADIEKNKEELDCAEPGCPTCAKLLDGLGVQVELVDQSGTILKTPVQGFHAIGPMSTITVKGKVERKGKKVLVQATGFFVG